MYSITPPCTSWPCPCFQVGITSLQDLVNKQAGLNKSSLAEFKFLKVTSNKISFWWLKNIDPFVWLGRRYLRFFRKKVIHFCVFVINPQVIVKEFTLYSNLKLSIICRKSIMIIIIKFWSNNYFKGIDRLCKVVESFFRIHLRHIKRFKDL